VDRQTSQLKVAVKGFDTVSNVFNTPYPSAFIGAYHCSGGLLHGLEIFNFSDIDCKFFPFPVRATLPCDVRLDEEGNQQYVMIKIRHSDLI
jgi:hypothetical protein